jgi:hypothetical protein
MENIEIYSNLINGEMVAIYNEDGSVTSMPKSTYDAMQAEQSTPMISGDE